MTTEVITVPVAPVAPVAPGGAPVGMMLNGVDRIVSDLRAMETRFDGHLRTVD